MRSESLLNKVKMDEIKQTLYGTKLTLLPLLRLFFMYAETADKSRGMENLHKKTTFEITNKRKKLKEKREIGNQEK